MKKLFRVIFSRYSISAALFLLELVAVALVVTYTSSYSYLFFLSARILNALVIISLISRDINPEFKVTWAVVLCLVPFFGSVLYLIFYSRKMSPEEIKRLKNIDALLNRDDMRSVSTLADLGAEDPSAAGRAVSLLHDDVYAELYRESKIKYFSSGESMYSALLKDLSKAESFIFLEYFIIEEGAMWQGIYDVLIKKRREGVDVRLVYDDIGCMKTLPRGFAARLKREGIKCKCFGRVSSRLMANHNNRDHRKIAVIDGMVAYTGGVNIADEYINARTRFGYWKDGGVRAEGRCAVGFMRLFLSNYYLCDGIEDEDADLALINRVNEISAETASQGDGGYYIPFGDGPAPLSPDYTSKNAIMNLINRAEKYLYITTPYLVIDYDLTEALRGAARRGVDVRIITPGIPDKKIVKVMTKSTYPALVSSGVRIFEYMPGFIHEKLIVSDDLCAMVGTVNLDYRSLVHHFENALWIYGSPEIREMRSAMLKTVSLCREIGQKEARLSIGERIVRAMVRLFSPLL